MGERGKRALRVKFDGKLKLEFNGSSISSDAGLIVYWFQVSYLNASLIGNVIRQWKILSQILIKILVSKDSLLNQGNFLWILKFKWEISN